MPAFKQFSSFSVDEGVSVDDGVVAGWASLYDVDEPPALIIRPGAFSESIAKRESRGHPLPMLFNHNGDHVLGEWNDLEDSDHGLYVRGTVDGGDIKNAPVLRQVRKKLISGLSIGITCEFDDLEMNDEFRLIVKRASLNEISVTPIPAMDLARIDRVEARQMNRGQLEANLRQFLSRGAAEVAADALQQNSGAPGAADVRVNSDVNAGAITVRLAAVRGVLATM